MKNNAPFRYVFITPADRDLFGQYVQLRRRVYLREYQWLPEDFGYEDETDGLSDILVAVQDGIVAAGARLTISTPEYPLPMPLEEAGFRLQECEQLADLDLSHQPYGEISRMAADPDFGRGFELSDGLGDRLCRRASATYGADTVFCICPPVPARINAINAKRRGVTFRRYLTLETVFNREMWLCAFLELHKIYRSNESEAA
jgi:hypothetical protein